MEDFNEEAPKVHIFHVDSHNIDLINSRNVDQKD